MTVDDNELPGMWEHADFTGGDPDERSHAERERQTVKKTPGLLGLERFLDTALAGVGDGVTLSQAAELVDDLTERAICDLGDSGRDGMKLLVRVAMAAREWQRSEVTADFLRNTGALQECVIALDEWERSL